MIFSGERKELKINHNSLFEVTPCISELCYKKSEIQEELQYGYTVLIKTYGASTPLFFTLYSLNLYERTGAHTMFTGHVRGGADKSLARPGRKQPTAIKLGFYSSHSSRSSIHFLARYSNFFKPLKKNLECCPSNQVSTAAMTSTSENNGDLSVVFSVQGTGGSPTGPDPENRVGDKDIGSPGRPVSSGLQVPGEAGHCRARTNPHW